MTRRALFDRIRRELSEVYPPGEAEAVALRLFGHFFGLDRASLFLEPQAGIVPDPGLEAAVQGLHGGRPLQYVLGEDVFCGLRLVLDERVLIPRPETEELVRWVADDHRGRAPKLLDVGTGSGAIAIALAHELTDSEVVAVDISVEALDVARANAGANGVSVRFFQLDILREKPAGKYDAIVSNPPYVRVSERAAMRPNVIDYEPHTALFVPDDDPLLFYRAIARRGLEALNPGGALYFEINEALGPQTAELLAQFGYEPVEIRRDIFGKERMIKGLRP